MVEHGPKAVSRGFGLDYNLLLTVVGRQNFIISKVYQKSLKFCLMSSPLIKRDVFLRLSVVINNDG